MERKCSVICYEMLSKASEDQPMKAPGAAERPQQFVAKAACSYNQAWPRAAKAAVQCARPGAALLMLLEPLLSFPQGPLEEGGFHDYVL